MRNVEKIYHIKSSIEDVFKALTEVEKIEEWSGATAKMDLAPRGEFSLWGGTIHGINEEVSLNRITQLWKEANWDSYSTCQFSIEQDGDLTKLRLTHAEIPESSVESIDKGWDEYYLGPLKEMLEN